MFVVLYPLSAQSSLPPLPGLAVAREGGGRHAAELRTLRRHRLRALPPPRGVPRQVAAQHQIFSSSSINIFPTAAARQAGRSCGSTRWVTVTSTPCPARSGRRTTPGTRGSQPPVSRVTCHVSRVTSHVAGLVTSDHNRPTLSYHVCHTGRPCPCLCITRVRSAALLLLHPAPSDISSAPQFSSIAAIE